MLDEKESPAPEREALTKDEELVVKLLTELIAAIRRLPEQHYGETRRGFDKVSDVTDWVYARAVSRSRSPEAVEAYRREFPAGSYNDTEVRLERLERRPS